MTTSHLLYGDDLAYIHDAGFSGFAEGCAPGLLEVLGKSAITDGLAVDLGCGGGIWAGRLLEAGYDVLGVDQSPALLAIARQRAAAAQFHMGSVWDCPIPKCRAVTALGEVLCYVSDEMVNHDLGLLFRKIHQSLDPGGLLIFDVAEVGLGRGKSPTWSEGDGWACLVRFEYSEPTSRLVRHITSFRRFGELFRRCQERHVVQLYRTQEVAAKLRSVGFRVRVVRKLGTFPLLPKRVGFIARKI